MPHTRHVLRAPSMVFAVSLLLFSQNSDSYGLLCLQFQATVEEGAVGVIVNLTVEDKDDPTTGAWRAAYTIINGNPGQSFEIHTNPETNEGMLSVVKVRVPPVLLLPCLSTQGPQLRINQPQSPPPRTKVEKVSHLRECFYPHSLKTSLFHVRGTLKHILQTFDSYQTYVKMGPVKVF